MYYIPQIYINKAFLCYLAKILHNYRMNKLQIYSDGACSGNPGPGGYAAIILDGDNEIVLRGSSNPTTNNRMELTAFIESIKYVKENHSNVDVEFFSDSKYLIDGVEKWMTNWKRRGWKAADKKPVKNLEMWQEIDELTKHVRIKFVWVKGHDGNQYNEMADEIAVEESMKLSR